MTFKKPAKEQIDQITNMNQAQIGIAELQVQKIHLTNQLDKLLLQLCAATKHQVSFYEVLSFISVKEVFADTGYCDNNKLIEDLIGEHNNILLQLKQINKQITGEQNSQT